MLVYEFSQGHLDIAEDYHLRNCYPIEVEAEGGCSRLRLKILAFSIL